MQKKIVEEVDYSEEVRNFFKSIPKEDFWCRNGSGANSITPKVSDVEKQVIDNGFKEVEEGSSFATKAVLYSKDPGSSSNGGIIK
jgi:peptidyl-prolyl cis-trans isomerase SurA